MYSRALVIAGFLCPLASVKSLRNSSSAPPDGVGLVIQLPRNWLGSRNAVSNHAGVLHAESIPWLSCTRTCQ